LKGEDEYSDSTNLFSVTGRSDVDDNSSWGNLEMVAKHRGFSAVAGGSDGCLSNRFQEVRKTQAALVPSAWVK
jgi:hypothetical protein